jgi:hypothetical protein
MILNSTKYQNPQRIITGLVNFVFNGDTILLCDTSLAAVSVTLLEIPNDQWNTTYKLYVVDNSNNAGTNNITIVAPIGFLINGASSLTISNNGGTALVTITSNTSYIGLLSSAGGGVGSISVLNQSVLISSAATSMNFIGIQASAVGSAITIQNNFISLTSAAFNVLVSANGLIPSQQYNITDAIFGNSTIPHNVYVTATSVNSISILGAGKFFNADYNGIGNYSGVTGYIGNLGVWTQTLVVAIGNVCIWNNLQYVNLTGVNNALIPPSADAVNWQFLTYNITNGYIVNYDQITYDVTSNEIQYRKDILSNEVEAYQVGIRSSLNDFAWGNRDIISNKVMQDSIFAICNTKITIGVNNNSITSALVYFFDAAIPLNWGVTDSFEYNSISFNFRPLYFQFFAGSATSNNAISVTYGSIINYQDYFQNVINACSVTIKNENLFSNNTISNSLLVNIVNTFTGNFSYNVFNAMIGLRLSSSSEIISNVGQYSEFLINETTAPVSYNEITNNSKLEVIVLNSAGIYYNSVKDFSTMSFNTNSGIIGNGGVGKGFGNILTNGSNFTILTNSGQHHGNIIDNSEIRISTCSGGISHNSLTGQSSIILLSYTLGIMKLLDLTNAQLGNITLNETKSFTGVYCAGNGSIEIEIDCSDVTIYDLATKTLNIPSQYFMFGGIYILTNANGLQINKILNLSSIFETTFRISFGTTTFITTGVGAVIGVGEIVSTYSPAPYSFNLVYRTKGDDYIKIKQQNIALTDTNEVTEVGLFL